MQTKLAATQLLEPLNPLKSGLGAAEQSLIAQGFIVRRTFIDIAEARCTKGLRPRSKSCGDQPSDLAELLKAVARPETLSTSAGETTPSCASDCGASVDENGLRDEVSHKASVAESVASSAAQDSAQQGEESPASSQATLSLVELLGQQQPAQAVPQAPERRPKAASSASRRRDPALSESSLLLDSAGSAHEVLQLASQASETMSVADVVCALHLVAKFVDMGAWGSLASADVAGLLQDPRFQVLVSLLQAHAASLDAPRLIMKAIWALGKVGAQNASVDSIITQVARIAPKMLPRFSTQEMSNTLWGLARLASLSRSRVSASSWQLTGAIIAESTKRVVELSGQCLTNSLWAVAKLELNDGASSAFVHACIEQIRRSNFNDISPQGLANSLWAVAKLRLSQEAAVGFCTEAAGRALSTQGLLALFQPQELSMALWAVARCVGRGTARQHQRGRMLPKEVEGFAAAVANEAFRRLAEFGPQGLSNIAWALATMDLLRHESSRRFILAAAQMSTPALADFPPQAIANFCWAMGRLGRAGEALAAFGAAAAHEAGTRGHEFSWQDLSGIVSAMMHVELGRVPQVRLFAISLVHRAAGVCNEIGTQALLNIALAAVRLGVSKEDLTPMAWGIAEAFTRRMTHLNDIDLRQWLEVQRYCQLPGCGDAPGRAEHGEQRQRRRR